MAKSLNHQRSQHGHHPPTISGSSSSSPFGGHEVNEVKLCRLVDTAFERIQELQGLCQQERKLTGVNKTSETLDPILRKQADLMGRIESMQRFKRSQRNMKTTRSMQFSPARGSTGTGRSASPRSNRNATGSHKMASESPMFVRNSSSGGHGSIAAVDNSGMARNNPGVSMMPTKSSMFATKTEGRNGSPIMSADSSIFPNRNHGYGPDRNEYLESKSTKRLDQTPFQQHNALGFDRNDRMKSSNGNGMELQPDQKYNKLTSSSFQFGLPTVAEVPSSKLRTIQALLSTPSNSQSRADRKSRSYLHDPNKPFMVLIPELQEMEKELRDTSADSTNNDSSGWSFHTANDQDSLLDFDMPADEVAESEEGAAALCPSMENLNLKKQEVDLDGNSNLQLESTKPFLMSDFYKYSAKWRQYLNSSSPTVPANNSQRAARRRSAVISELQRGRFGNDFCDGAVTQNSPNSEPPLPPRTKLPRNMKQSTETSNNNEAWVMDTPTIV